MYTPKYTQQTDFNKETLGDIRIRQQELNKTRSEMQHDLNCLAQESILIHQTLQSFTLVNNYPASPFPQQFMNGPQFGFQMPTGYGNGGVPPTPDTHPSHCNHNHNLNPNAVFGSRSAVSNEEIVKLGMFRRNALNFLKGRLEALEAAYEAEGQPNSKLGDAVKLEIINIKDFLANHD